MRDGFDIVDAHVHYAGIFLQKGKTIVDYMDENGVDAAILNTLNTKANLGDVMRKDPAELAMRSQDPSFEIFKDFRLSGQPGHEAVSSLARKYPDRLFPFFWYNPADPGDLNQEMGLAAVADALDRGFKGVKIQPAMTACTVEQLFPVASVLTERERPIYIHPNAGLFASRKTEAVDVARLAKSFPKLDIILGHAAYTMEFCIEAVLHLARFPNVHAETSQSIPYGIITFAKIFGPRRVLFGTDMPSATPFDIEYRKLALLDVPADAKALILGGNARRLLGLAG
ncbi:MAG: amidohydrolase family protein [Candidatus Lokiarchaeota archaeon]|nr:amidohydrolase family protein [Candidatus Lokiarchaeota archaeon]